MTARKVTLMGCAVLYSERPQLQCFSSLMVIFMATVLHVACQPYEALGDRKVFDHLEGFSMLCSFVIFSCGTLTFLNDVTSGEKDVASLGIVASNLAFIALFLFAVIRTKKALIAAEKAKVPNGTFLSLRIRMLSRTRKCMHVRENRFNAKPAWMVWCTLAPSGRRSMRSSESAHHLQILMIMRAPGRTRAFVRYAHIAC